jgi:hypothetical protein
MKEHTMHPIDIYKSRVILDINNWDIYGENTSSMLGLQFRACKDGGGAKNGETELTIVTDMPEGDFGVIITVRDRYDGSTREVELYSQDWRNDEKWQNIGLEKITIKTAGSMERRELIDFFEKIVSFLRIVE